MKYYRYISGFLACILAGCAVDTGGLGKVTDRPPSQNVQTSLPEYGPAPELTNEVWLNVDQPLRLEKLLGQVVAIDMWTFG